MDLLRQEILASDASDIEVAPPEIGVIWLHVLKEIATIAELRNTQIVASLSSSSIQLQENRDLTQPLEETGPGTGHDETPNSSQNDEMSSCVKLCQVVSSCVKLCQFGNLAISACGCFTRKNGGPPT